MIPENAWVILLQITWMSPKGELRHINNSIMQLATNWVEERGLFLAGGPSKRLPQNRRLEMRLIVEASVADLEAGTLPEQIAVDFLSFLQHHALANGWNLNGSYRRFREEEGLLLAELPV